MIRFKQFLLESLDSSYSVNYKTNDSQHTFYTFKDNNGNNFEVATFRNKVIDKTILEVAFVMRQWNNKTTSQPTGVSKNALKIYSTIGKELRNYVKSNPVDVITFSAASGRTHVIYDNLAKKIAKELNGTVKKSHMREGTWEIYL